MSPLLLLGVFAVLFTLVPVGPIETLVLDRLTVTPAGATTARVALTVVLSVLLSATGIANCCDPTGANKRPSFPELPLTLRVIAITLFLPRLRFRSKKMVGLEHQDETATPARLASFEHPDRKGAARTSVPSVQCKFVAIGPKVSARVSERFAWSQYLVADRSRTFRQTKLPRDFSTLVHLNISCLAVKN